MRRMYSENQLENKVKSVQKDISTLVDADGHDRFIEGDIDLLNTVPEAITKVYGKWSLSGSHLLVVLVINIADATTFTGSLCQVSVPQWVKDKLVAMFSNAIDYRTFNAFNTDLSVQQFGAYLRKVSDSVIDVYATTITTTKERVVRINFDLLIDND